MRPLVTICVPVYNGEKYLVTCLDSLLQQRFRDFKVLISDNDSSDSTADISLRYAAADSRVEYVRQHRNIGLYANFRYLLGRVESKYVKVANADDWWAPEMIGDAVEVLERDSEVVLCYPRMVMIDSAGRETARYEDEFATLQNDPFERFKFALTNLRLINQISGVMRTSVVQRAMPLMDQPGSDAVLISELCLYGKIALVDKYQFFRRFHEESSSYSRTSREHQRKFVGASGSRTFALERWRHHCGLLRRVIHSPLHAKAKLWAVSYVVRRMLWDRRTLLREFTERVRGTKV